MSDIKSSLAKLVMQWTTSYSDPEMRCKVGAQTQVKDHWYLALKKRKLKLEDWGLRVRVRVRRRLWFVLG